MTIDFVALIERCYPPDAPPDRAALDALWTALFTLPEWHFLMTPRSAQANQPSVQIIEDKDWMLVFTDAQLLKQYATQNQNLAADGSALFMSMPPDAARTFIAGADIYGVRFNEAAKHGWFAPVQNIAGIYEYLKKHGKL